MTMSTIWTVRELATLAGVSVRTLHHYHHIGLLLPARVGDNGYRYYGRAELVRLQQILFFRELEFPLDRIRELLGRPGFDATAAYRDHRRLLMARREQLDRLIATLDTELIPQGADDMTTNDRPVDDRFTETGLDELRAEAKERWGGTDAWRRSDATASDRTLADWQEIQRQMDDAVNGLIADMPKGIASPGVQRHIAGYRAWLGNHYEPTDEIFRGLATMYVEDDRFAETFRRYHPDLPVFLRDAMLYSLGDR